MRGRSGFVTVAALAILLAVGGTTLVGCDAGPPTGPVKAGYKAGSLGSAEVVGYLSRSDLEGGSWVVYSLPTTSSVAPPNVLAVLLPGSVDEGGIAALDGRYVWAAGRVSGGASTRMAGPEILVDSIDVVQAP
ncbi:MAG TPA: hypothetical protein VIL06_08930 [Coriobacteriia bacterium]